MTVTNEKSVQITNQEAGVKNEAVSGFGGRLFPMVVQWVAALTGSANSTQEFGILPPGKWRYLSQLSRVRTTAFGSSRTLDIGHGAYTEPDGTAVPANEDAIHSAKDVSSATNWVPGQGDELDDATAEFGTLLINSKTPVTITGIIKAGTVVIGNRVDGVLVFLGY